MAPWTFDALKSDGADIAATNEAASMFMDFIKPMPGVDPKTGKRYKSSLEVTIQYLGYFIIVALIACFTFLAVVISQFGTNNNDTPSLHPDTFTSVGGVQLTAAETGVVATSSAIFGAIALIIVMMLCASQILEREPKRRSPVFQRSSSEFL